MAYGHAASYGIFWSIFTDRNIWSSIGITEENFTQTNSANSALDRRLLETENSSEDNAITLHESDGTIGIVLAIEKHRKRSVKVGNASNDIML